MAARVLAQLILMGSQIVGRAMFQAYHQALQNAAKNGAAAAAGGAESSGRMSIAEARKILNVPAGVDKQTVESVYERLYTANDPARGGSAYLQAKIKGARNRLSTTSTQDSGGNTQT